nr:hypothetical protein CFP56_47997 [Quercus suber]
MPSNSKAEGKCKSFREVDDADDESSDAIPLPNQDYPFSVYSVESIKQENWSEHLRYKLASNLVLSMEKELRR